MKLIFLALGSNLGNRHRNLERAVERLSSSEVRVLRKSSIYKTKPRDVPDQPWFLNQVVEIETSLLPRQLLQRTQRIEHELGRKSTVPQGPRVIDLDILLYANAVVATPTLEIPHPRMADRRFVLEPLAELASDLRHPRTGRSVREMLAEVANQTGHKI